MRHFTSEITTVIQFEGETPNQVKVYNVGGLPDEALRAIAIETLAGHLGRKTDWDAQMGPIERVDEKLPGRPGQWFFLHHAEFKMEAK